MSIFNLITLPFRIAVGIVLAIVAIFKFITSVVLAILGVILAFFIIIVIPVGCATCMVHTGLYPNTPQTNMLDLSLYIHHKIFWEALLGVYLGFFVIIIFLMCYYTVAKGYETDNCISHTLKYGRQLRYDQITGKKR